MIDPRKVHTQDAQVAQQPTADTVHHTFVEAKGEEPRHTRTQRKIGDAVCRLEECGAGNVHSARCV